MYNEILFTCLCTCKRATFRLLFSKPVDCNLKKKKILKCKEREQFKGSSTKITCVVPNEPNDVRRKSHT